MAVRPGSCDKTGANALRLITQIQKLSCPAIPSFVDSFAESQLLYGPRDYLRLVHEAVSEVIIASDEDHLPAREMVLLAESDPLAFPKMHDLFDEMDTCRPRANSLGNLLRKYKGTMLDGRMVSGQTAGNNRKSWCIDIVAFS